jgi:hypothetical protein
VVGMKKVDWHLLEYFRTAGRHQDHSLWSSTFWSDRAGAGYWAKLVRPWNERSRKEYSSGEHLSETAVNQKSKETQCRS